MFFRKCLISYFALSKERMLHFSPDCDNFILYIFGWERIGYWVELELVGNGEGERGEREGRGFGKKTNIL